MDHEHRNGEEHEPIRGRALKPVPVAWLAGLGVVVAVVLVAVAGSSSAACALCHRELVTGLGRTAHASTGCYDCHLEKGAWSLPGQKTDELFVMYPRKVFGADRPRLVETSRDACLECHVAILQGVASANGRRIDHGACAADSSCDDCHATVGHGARSVRLTSAAMNDCIRCHTSQDASVECTACHEGDGPSERPRPTAWRVTHGPDWQQTHGMGDLWSCASCHDPSYCIKCHDVAIPHPKSFGESHGSEAVEHPGSCSVCHDRASLCDPCHGFPMPHPRGFVRVHSETAASLDDPRCARCHTMTDCKTCHANHVHPGGSTPPPGPAGADR